MNGKGDKPRFYPDDQYRNNYDKIFNKGKKMSSEVTPEMYLEMWLSEQIPTGEWLRLLEWRPDINELYQKHLEKVNDL